MAIVRIAAAIPAILRTTPYPSLGGYQCLPYK
jgi:hypothetical protein